MTFNFCIALMMQHLKYPLQPKVQKIVQSKHDIVVFDDTVY